MLGCKGWIIKYVLALFYLLRLSEIIVVVFSRAHCELGVGTFPYYRTIFCRYLLAYHSCLSYVYSLVACLIDVDAHQFHLDL